MVPVYIGVTPGIVHNFSGTGIKLKRVSNLVSKIQHHVIG